ncbi:hypothetical protein [Paenibacillus naphthalenovorans]|uniref:Uncharacterized protein n=1 Tax=Paenibacillus naphthalenovorans TaxID=162209 RepID=A0A0U2IM69_9BACL|nr:hypothetical protein [Paenibacillus naphthalenovorans]ALS22123.1 hypothetical protein IJ22_17490 [Paenibacillus naphthalenovorans]
MKFYALANTKENATTVLELQSNIRHRAKIEAKEIAHERGLEYVDVYHVRGSHKGASTMQKRFSSGDPTPRSKR